MVYSLERVNTCFRQENVNPIAMPISPSAIIESSSTLLVTSSVLELPDPEGRQEIEAMDRQQEDEVKGC
jgi:hypothetical protein